MAINRKKVNIGVGLIIAAAIIGIAGGVLELFRVDGGDQIAVVILICYGISVACVVGAVVILRSSRKSKQGNP